MRHNHRRIVIGLIIAALLVLPVASPALAENPSVKNIEPSAESMTADVALLRPVGFIGQVIGGIVWVVSLPFSGLGDNFNQATQELVVKPAKFTWTRPLGSL